MRNGGNSKLLVSFLLLLLLLVPTVTHAYANWLDCYVELDDEDEVIMHKPIKKVEDQSTEEQKVMIEVQPFVALPGTLWDSATLLNLDGLFPSPNPTTNLLKVRLKLPPSLQPQPRKSVQFVAQVSGEGVSFVGQGVMCDGRRVSSKKHDQHVLLQIASNTNNSNIELVAAWARGYEAVKLTQKLIVKRSIAAPIENESEEAMLQSSDEL